MLISKSDLKTYAQFSDNIEDRLINFHIQKVQDTQIEPLLDPIMFANLEIIVASPSNSYPELETLFDNYIKPWIAYNVIYSFYTQHGINVTQYGMRVASEDTSQPVAPEERAVMLRTIQTDANNYYLRFQKQLYKDDLTYDGITYTDVCEKNKGVNVGMKAINRVGKKFYPYTPASEYYKYL